MLTVFLELSGGMSKVKKLIPCRHYASSGTCFYGEQCQFMHVPVATTPFQNEMVCMSECIYVVYM